MLKMVEMETPKIESIVKVWLAVVWSYNVKFIMPLPAGMRGKLSGVF